ncbi:MAG: hypothetical protein PHT83_05910 [Bacilli bacterium]|nr:hypothetical protein [Bacilli bacterium]
MGKIKIIGMVLMLICCLSLYGCQKYPVPSLDKTSFFESNDPNIWFKNTLRVGFNGEIIIGNQYMNYICILIGKPE